MSIGLSVFARKRQTLAEGNSFFKCKESFLCGLVLENWVNRKPGQGETGLDRKVVVPVPPGYFFLPRVPLTPDLPVQASVVQRQEGEDYHVETYVRYEDIANEGIEFQSPTHVDIVCYSAEALLENGGRRSTSCDWEIVAIVATNEEVEPMKPLTMARNFLEKAGGTKSEYTAKEFAESIYYWSNQGGVRVKDVKLTKSQTLVRMCALSRELHSLATTLESSDEK